MAGSRSGVPAASSIRSTLVHKFANVSLYGSLVLVIVLEKRAFADEDRFVEDETIHL